jgi:hypothetical protein
MTSAGAPDRSWDGRSHFVTVAAEVMHQLPVESAGVGDGLGLRRRSD